MKDYNDIRQWVADRFELEDAQVDTVTDWIWQEVAHPITDAKLDNLGSVVDMIVAKV